MQYGHKKQNTERGFTLIETFVAISILMLALVGPLSLAQQSLSSATSSADQITAFFLAQDAFEYIRNVRDSNLKNGDDWLTGFTTGNCLDRTCRIDTSDDAVMSSAVQACSGSTCLLLYNQSLNAYSHKTSAGWVDSRFSREIFIDVIDSSREVIVTVTVSWSEGGESDEFTASQSFFNLTIS